MEEEVDSSRGYAEKWAKWIREAYQVASKNSQQSSAKGKRYYDRHNKGVIL